MKFHFGNWLRSHLDKSGENYAAFAKRVPISKVTLHSYMSQQHPPIAGPKAGKLAKALNISKAKIDVLLKCAADGVPDAKALAAAELIDKAVPVVVEGMKEVAGSGLADVEAHVAASESNRRAMQPLVLDLINGKLKPADVDDDERQDLVNLFAVWEMKDRSAREHIHQMRDSVLGHLDVADSSINNVEMATLRELKRIPVWELDIAASGWVTVPISGALDYDDDRQRAVVEQGLFRVHVSGDSMKEDWLPGDCVEFELFRPDRDVLSIGEDYLCIRADSMGTFKRLEKFDEDSLIFRATNKKKYPATMKVARQDVVRMARALHVVIDRRKR